MKKLALLVPLLFLLAACGEATFEQQANVDARLPEGCVVTDLGPYGAINRLVAVICDGRSSSTLNWRQQVGKTSYPRASVTIND